MTVEYYPDSLRRKISEMKAEFPQIDKVFSAIKKANAISNFEDYASLEREFTVCKGIYEELKQMKTSIHKLRFAAQYTADQIKTVDGLGLFDRGNLSNLLTLALDQTKEYDPCA